MSVEVQALPLHHILDKDTEGTVWAISLPPLRWFEVRGPQFKHRFIRFSGDSMREVAQAAKALRDSCPGKPYYLEEDGISRWSTLWTPLRVTRACPGPGIIVTMGLSVQPEKNPTARREDLGVLSLKEIHKRLRISV